ncbi:major facilitator superfamily domain-containing protein [Pyrenochaeta sp. MPI-SDFR-AT-0127]|nr:major facilitator superfamily domain-containing protein [Pyrenochaeta sp. MPI-SDFR-AT-0127]
MAILTEQESNRELTLNGTVTGEKGKDASLSSENEDTVPQQLGDIEGFDSDQAAGLAKMEAITLVWTKNWLITAYALIWAISFVNSLQQQANWSWKPYVTSEFLLHGLTGMTDVVAQIVGGVSKLPLAKFIDLVGRLQGFLVCLICVTLALLLMTICENVQTFAAAQVFYWSGMNGIDYIFNIFIADTSLLENRLIWMALQGTPYICNTFAGPSLGEKFLKDSSWRWGYGAFTIITPVVGALFWAVFWWMERRAKLTGMIKKEKSDRTLLQSIWHWAVEFDVIGLVLVCGGFSLFLLPFNLAALQKKGWGSPMIICMLVFGLVLIALFMVWERFFALKSFFPFHLMKDRSVVAACFLGANSFIVFYSYKGYYSSYLQVAFGLSVAKAGYITNIYSLVSCTWAVAISFAFKYTDTYKWGAVVALPIQVLMTGLLIKFRQPGTAIGLLVMVEVFIAMCGAVFVQIETMAIMAAVPHEHVATGLALLAMITSVGGAIGQTICSTIWTHTIPGKLLEYLPTTSRDQAKTLGGSLPAVLLLPRESLEYQAVVSAYGDVQKLMLIVATCALVPCFLWVAMLKNYRMSEHAARKGLQA